MSVSLVLKWLLWSVLVATVAGGGFDISTCNSTITSMEMKTVVSPLPDSKSRFHGSPLTCVHHVRPPAVAVAGASVVRIVFLRLRTGELHLPRDGSPAACVGGHLTIVDGVAAAHGKDFGKFCGEAEQVGI